MFSNPADNQKTKKPNITIMATAKPTAAKPALKKPASKAPAFTPAVGDVIVFGEYESEQESPLLTSGDYVRITEIDKTKKNRVRYHVTPITGDEDGNARPSDTAFIEELLAPTPEQSEEIASLLAQAESPGDEDEDLAALGASADAGDETAQARLTELATEDELDPEAYPTWAELATALTPEDLAALGVAADGGDEAAQARLTELAGEAEVDPEKYADWAGVAAALESGDVEAVPEPEPEPVAKGAKAAKGAPAAKAAKGNAKKASTTPKPPKLALTPTMEAVLAECNNDLLSAMQQTEKRIGQSFLDLGGLIKLGEIQNAHRASLDPTTGKPLYEDSKKGYYTWVSANLETEERVARHLAKIYQVFIAKLKFEPEGLIELGISRLREIAPIALKLAKSDKEANAELKAAGKEETANSLEAFLQESASLTVRDVVTRVRAIKSPEGNGGGGGGAPPVRVATLTFRMFEDKAAFVKTCLDNAMAGLPDAEKNQDNALFRIFADYASSNELPAFVAKPVAKAATVAKAAPAAKAAKAAPAAKPVAKAAKAAKAK